VDEWRLKDPIIRVEKILIERGILSEEECRKLETEVRERVEDAIRFAENSPEPAIESIFEDIFTKEGA